MKRKEEKREIFRPIGFMKVWRRKERRKNKNIRRERKKGKGREEERSG